MIIINSTVSDIPAGNIYVQLNNLHIFVDFTTSNLTYVKTIDPTTVPHFYIIINRIDGANRINAIRDLLLYCKDTRDKWRIPMTCKIHGPLRHPSIGDWVKANIASYEKTHCDRIVYANNYRFYEEKFANDQRLLIEYLPIHIGNQQLRLTREEAIATGVNQWTPPWNSIILGTYRTYT